MRHKKRSRKLSRNRSHRKAVLRNLVRSLLMRERITTTITLAKESQRVAEKLITLGKRNTFLARRQAFKMLTDRDLIRTLFIDIAPRFTSRSGGYTRIVRLGHRPGDNAKLAILELTELKKEEKKPKKIKSAKKEQVQELKDIQTIKQKAEPKTKEKELIPPQEETQEKTKASEKKEVKKEAKKEEHKGFFGGLRKFLKKQDKAE